MGACFFTVFLEPLSPCAVWNKTQAQLVVSSLLVWQWGCCESGDFSASRDFKTALCCNIHLGVGTNFWRFINLVLEEAHHRKCFIPYISFSWPWFIGLWYYKSCFLIPSSQSELSGSFCRAKLAPFSFPFSFFKIFTENLVLICPNLVHVIFPVNSLVIWECSYKEYFCKSHILSI